MKSTEHNKDASRGFWPWIIAVFVFLTLIWIYIIVFALNRHPEVIEVPHP